jgi:hypothetical protein
MEPATETTLSGQFPQHRWAIGTIPSRVGVVQVTTAIIAETGQLQELASLEARCVLANAPSAIKRNSGCIDTTTATGKRPSGYHGDRKYVMVV